MSPQLEIQNIIRSELARIQAKNPHFSLRSFAKKLGLSPATLSEVIRGKRPVSAKSAKKIITSIQLPAETTANILETFKNRDSRNQADFTQLSLDQFHVISDWHCFAILSLALTKNFKDDSQWIGKRLNISEDKVNDALDRLKRLKMLVQNSRGKWVHGGESYAVASPQMRELSIQRHHQQTIELAADANREVAFDQGNFSGTTMAIDPKLLPEAGKMITQFRAKLCKFLESGEKLEVYRFNAQLFPLTKVESEVV